MTFWYKVMFRNIRDYAMFRSRAFDRRYDRKGISGTLIYYTRNHSM